MNKPAKFIAVALAVGAFGSGGLLVSRQPGEVALVGPIRATVAGEEIEKRDQVASASRVYVLPTRSSPVPAGWRPLAAPLGMEGVGFVVDRATLGWLPREFALEEGDAILRINGEAVTSTDQLVEAVQGSSEGSAVEFQIRLAGTSDAVSYSVAR